MIGSPIFQRTAQNLVSTYEELLESRNVGLGLKLFLNLRRTASER